MNTLEFQLATVDDIAKRCRASNSYSFLGFDLQVLLSYLDFDLAAEFLDPDTTAKDWGKPEALDRDTVVASLRHYTEFAWGKALGHRGISAGRSVEKIREWLFILGDSEAVAYTEDDSHYPQYGVPVLLFVSRRYGFPVPEDVAVGRMAKGLPCEPGCAEGCDKTFVTER